MHFPASPLLRFRVQGGQGRRATRSGACLEGPATLVLAAGDDGGKWIWHRIPLLRNGVACIGRPDEVHRRVRRRSSA